MDDRTGKWYYIIETEEIYKYNKGTGYFELIK